MKWSDFEVLSENPLDKLLDDGGFCAIFRRIGCIGDSLSSGEFEALKEDGSHSYHDCYEYSWGQFIARMTGAEVLNFSCGGMSSYSYMMHYGDQHGVWDVRKACQAYIIALGYNDLRSGGREVGSFEDIDFENWKNNNLETFAGAYTAIIQRYRIIQPHARFFLVTMPKEQKDDERVTRLKQHHADFLYELAAKFPYTYVIDFHKYAPTYDEEYYQKFGGHIGHLNPMGYQLTAKMIATYIDYLIRKDFDSFKQVGFIGKKEYDERYDKRLPAKNKRD